MPLSMLAVVIRRLCAPRAAFDERCDAAAVAHESDLHCGSITQVGGARTSAIAEHLLLSPLGPAHPLYTPAYHDSE